MPFDEGEDGGGGGGGCDYCGGSGVVRLQGPPAIVCVQDTMEMFGQGIPARTILSKHGYFTQLRPCRQCQMHPFWDDKDRFCPSCANTGSKYIVWNHHCTATKDLPDKSYYAMSCAGSLNPTYVKREGFSLLDILKAAFKNMRSP